MSKSKSDKFPVCGNIEDWSHMIRFPLLKEKSEKFMRNMKN